ncbi:AI-2E family transporter [Bacteroidia bacterium]|nr:AI-2E family transporter [Bacteroidia bacterium]
MNGIIGFIGAVFILYIGRPVFIPILLAIFIWYLINSITAYYRKILPYGQSIISGVIASIFSVATLAGFVYLFASNIRPMFAQLLEQLPTIQERLQSFLHYMSDQLGFSAVPSTLPDMSAIASGIGMSALGMAASFGMVLVYIFFIFVEQSTFAKKLGGLFPEKKRFKKMHFIMQSIDHNMKKYMFMKTLISALTAVLSYAWMTYLNIEFAGVWAFMIFILNYIPTFGSIIAVVLPVLYVVVMQNTDNLPVMLAGGLITLQILLGNIIEPRLTGKTLNLSTLAILINLVFWGMLWGVTGAFFSVPILVAFFVVTAQFDSTRWIAVMLSTDGKIPEKED